MHLATVYTHLALFCLAHAASPPVVAPPIAAPPSTAPICTLQLTSQIDAAQGANTLLATFIIANAQAVDLPGWELLFMLHSGLDYNNATLLAATGANPVSDPSTPNASLSSQQPIRHVVVVWVGFRNFCLCTLLYTTNRLANVDANQVIPPGSSTSLNALLRLPGDDPMQLSNIALNGMACYVLPQVVRVLVPWAMHHHPSPSSITIIHHHHPNRGSTAWASPQHARCAAWSARQPAYACQLTNPAVPIIAASLPTPLVAPAGPPRPGCAYPDRLFHLWGWYHLYQHHQGVHQRPPTKGVSCKVMPCHETHLYRPLMLVHRQHQQVRLPLWCLRESQAQQFLQCCLLLVCCGLYGASVMVVAPMVMGLEPILHGSGWSLMQVHSRDYPCLYWHPHVSCHPLLLDSCQNTRGSLACFVTTTHS